MPLLIYASSQLSVPAAAQHGVCITLQLSSWVWFLSGQRGVCDWVQPVAIAFQCCQCALRGKWTHVLECCVCSVWLQLLLYHGYLILSKYWLCLYSCRHTQADWFTANKVVVAVWSSAQATNVAWEAKQMFIGLSPVDFHATLQALCRLEEAMRNIFWRFTIPSNYHWTSITTSQTTCSLMGVFSSPCKIRWSRLLRSTIKCQTISCICAKKHTKMKCCMCYQIQLFLLKHLYISGWFPFCKMDMGHNMLDLLCMYIPRRCF